MRMGLLQYIGLKSITGPYILNSNTENRKNTKQERNYFHMEV